MRKPSYIKEYIGHSMDGNSIRFQVLSGSEKKYGEAVPYLRIEDMRYGPANAGKCMGVIDGLPLKCLVNELVKQIKKYGV